jgi:hypothetical protein
LFHRLICRGRRARRRRRARARRRAPPRSCARAPGTQQQRSTRSH